MSTFRIRTPHAAVKIWNYVDRIQAEGASKKVPHNAVSEVIVSTISCNAIQTVKTKANPVGQFNFVLAPTRNWTATITPGSWCVVMMSNEPITKEDLATANPKLVKMVGKIDSVRTSVTTTSGGARVTQFLVSGQDWGHIFNNTLYIDPLIVDSADQRYDQGNTLFLELIRYIKRDGAPMVTRVRENILSLLEIFGKPLSFEDKLERLGKNTHNIVMPNEMAKFFGFENKEIFKEVHLYSGALNSEEAKYDIDVNDGLGWINPFSLVGANNLWQVLQDNANYVLNEMFNDLIWEDSRPKFGLFNRIKPFAFRQEPLGDQTTEIRSLFKNVPSIELDEATIISVNAGTNWRDKYNFIEIKPEAAEFSIYDNWVKQKAQAWDDSGSDVFDREGFRPLIMSVKQIPFKKVEVAKTGEYQRRRKVRGYWKNKPIDLTICTVNGANAGDCWVAEAIVDDTQAWFDAAKADGLQWSINASYRTMRQQQNLQSTGLAAKPGLSMHQCGCAIDIQPILDNTSFHSSTPEGQEVLARLEVIGQQYGWERPYADEPWHFEYRKWTPSDAEPNTVITQIENSDGTVTTYHIDPRALVEWTSLLQEWYFDTHRLLNGQITMTGSTEHIPVGYNIMFDAGLLGVKTNLNAGHIGSQGKSYILAHVETVKNVFKVDDRGARTYQTVIEFVRGIVVDKNKNLIGEGTLDTLSTALKAEETVNNITVVASATPDDPGEKIK